MITMKCDSCKNKIAVEPYTRHDFICKKGHWEGDDSTGDEPDMYWDAADNCEDYESEGEL